MILLSFNPFLVRASVYCKQEIVYFRTALLFQSLLSQGISLLKGV